MRGAEAWRSFGANVPSPVIDVHTHCPHRGLVRAAASARRSALQREAGGRRAARDPSRRRAVHDAGARDVRLRPASCDDERVRRGRLRRVAHLSERVLGRAGREPQGGADHERRHGGRADRASGSAALVRVAALAISRARARRARSRACRRRVGRDGAREHRRPLAHRSGVRADLGRDRCEGASGARASDRAAGRRRDGHGALPAHGVDRLHVRHVARGRADDLRRLLRPLSQAARSSRRTAAARCRT